MQRRTVVRGVGAAVVLLAAALVAAGCQSIAGIEDRTLQPASQQQCIEYCDTVQKNCTNDNKVYPDKKTCLAVCAALPPGKPSDPQNANTVACRLTAARAATDSAAQQENCPAAGPGGAGGCGTDCEAYCTLLSAICPDDSTIVPDCKKKCAAIADPAGFTPEAQKGDTVQCRLAQLGAATQDPTHCLHARFQTSNGVCKHDSQTSKPDCADYCRAVMVACTGDVQQYVDEATCEAVCADLPRGSWDDTNKVQSIGCRYYHSFFALGKPGTHCPHAGPGGDGTCSDPTSANCQSYCILLEAGCKSEFDGQFGGAQDPQGACISDCGSIQGGGTGELFSTDSSGNKTPSPMFCRLQNLSDVIAGKQGADCQNLGNGCP